MCVKYFFNFRVAGYFCDGWDKSTSTDLEFQVRNFNALVALICKQYFSFSQKGCLWHAHKREDPNCPISRSVETTPFGTPFDKVHQQRLERKRKLEALGIRVVEKFECEFLREKQENEHLKEFLKTYHRQRPEERLTIRDGLRGGRCV